MVAFYLTQWRPIDGTYDPSAFEHIPKRHTEPLDLNDGCILEEDPFEIKPSLRLQGQGGIKTSRYRIANGLSRKKIHQDRQIDKARGDADISDIGHPGLIDGRYGTILQKIGIQRIAMIALGCPDPSLLGTTE
jgi:hypothetical protein